MSLCEREEPGPMGVCIKGMVNLPTIEYLDWELTGVKVDLEELQDKHRRTRITIIVLSLLALIARAYGY